LEEVDEGEVDGKIWIVRENVVELSVKYV